MKDRPILFSGPMVRAILAGTKTQTRRVVKGLALEWLAEFTPEFVADPANSLCPYGVPGDRLWVREAYRFLGVHDHVPPREVSSGPVWYEAQDDVPFHPSEFGKLRPSMFMPRWASRITLEVTGVRVERLQDISEADSVAEGIPSGEVSPPDVGRFAYRLLWESINGPGSWDANPWVWAVEFKRITP